MFADFTFSEYSSELNICTHRTIVYMGVARIFQRGGGGGGHTDSYRGYAYGVMDFFEFFTPSTDLT